VLDVKVGSGAFMKSREEAEALARSMISTSASLGTKAVALLTDMGQPLGTHVGNALEVLESLAVLRGEGPEDLESLCLELTARMLVLGNVASSREDGLRQAREELASGRGLSKFLDMVQAQGGDERVAEDGVLPKARFRKEVAGARDGFVSSMDAEKLGTAAMLLGAGREKVVDRIDPAAGLIVHKKIGHEVRTGEPLVTLHYNDGSRLAEAERRVREAYVFSNDRRAAAPELVMAAMES
jgi:thymidine phosphorylase